MIKSLSQEKDTVTEKQFLTTAAQCFLLFEQYRLKTNVVGINLEKDMVPECYYQLEGRMLERYDLLFEELQEAINKLENNFKIAKATHLRSLNNIMRNYRRRVGTINNEPMANFKYNRFDRSQKILLQALVYNDKDSYDDILKFKEELTIATEQGKNQIRDHYRKNPKIDEDFRHVLEVIDRTECYTYKYYENFERSMQTTAASLESYFDKLNGYLTVWENLGSIKAYQIKSSKQLAMEDKKNDSYSRRFQEEYDQQELEELIERCPENSHKRQQYKLRLLQLKQVNKQKERKMERVGKMFNRRRNRDGILTNRRKDVTVLDWYFNLQNEKANFSFNDDLKLSSQSTQNEYRPSEYEIQKPFKKEKLDEIREHLEKYQKSSAQNTEWWYDKYGKQGIFDLILCSSQQIQKRVQFEISRQLDFQNADDRKKRDIFDRQVHHIRDAERKEGLHIGYLYANEKEELEELQDRTYSTEYFPDLIAAQVSESSFQFTDQEISSSESDESEKEARRLKEERKTKKKDKKLHVSKEQPKMLQRKSNQPKSNEGQKSQPEDPQNSQDAQGEDKDESFEFNNASLEQQLIQSYFSQYSKKVHRKEAEPEYKKSKFIYCSDLSQVRWSDLSKYFDCEKIFVYTKEVIIYVKRVFSAKKEKIKCIVYTLKEDLDEETIRQELTNCFIQLSLVTVKFVSIYSDIEGQDKIYFMIGLLLILVQKGEMIQGYEPENYIKEGKIIVEDFHCYFNPQEHYTSKNLYMRIRTSKAVSVFAKKDKKEEEKSLKNGEEVSEKGTLPTLISANTDKLQSGVPQASVQGRKQGEVQHEMTLKHSSSKQHLETYDLEKSHEQGQKSQKSEEEPGEEEYQSL